MRRLGTSIIRASSFLAKEFYEVLRQPRLIISLILGPFLILFLFGIGYRDQQRNMRTIFVIPKDAVVSGQDIIRYTASISQLITIEGETSNLQDALNQLQQGKVDMVVQEPSGAYNSIKHNEQAAFHIYHNEIDPVQADYIDYLGWLYVGAVNQQVLQAFTAQGQKDATQMRLDLLQAHKNVAATKEAIQSGGNAASQQQALSGNLNSISALAGGTLSLMDSMPGNVGADNTANPSTNSVVTDLNQNTEALNNPSTSPQDRLQRLNKIDSDLTSLDSKLKLFQSVEPSVIVSPFINKTMSIAHYTPSLLSFFVPAVLALLLQHVAVTFAALSMVRERNVGTVELFKVSPISATEVLFGKYLSYMIFGGIIATALALLLTYLLHIPMFGSWWYFALTIAGILFTSMGFGFVISLLSQTDSQAVQYSMILLLASVFFSGFIMGLEKFSTPIKVISWLLPTTYGTSLLRNIELRGLPPNPLLLAGLFAIGVVLLLIAWLLTRRVIGTVHWQK